MSVSLDQSNDRWTRPLLRHLTRQISPTWLKLAVQSRGVHLEHTTILGLRKIKARQKTCSKLPRFLVMMFAWLLDSQFRVWPILSNCHNNSPLLLSFPSSFFPLMFNRHRCKLRAVNGVYSLSERRKRILWRQCSFCDGYLLYGV